MPRVSAESDQSSICVHWVKMTEASFGCVNWVKMTEASFMMWGGLAQWLASWTTDQGVTGSRPGRGTGVCGLEQVTFTHCFKTNIHLFVGELILFEIQKSQVKLQLKL